MASTLLLLCLKNPNFFNTTPVTICSDLRQLRIQSAKRRNEYRQIRGCGRAIIICHSSQNSLLFNSLWDGLEVLGAGEIRLAAVYREGTRKGMDLELLQRVQKLVSVPVILEGGAGTLDQLGEAMTAGADGVAVGTMLVFSDNNLVKIKRYLAAAGHDMRIA